MFGSPSDHWMQFNHHNHNAFSSADHGRAALTIFGDATAVTTTLVTGNQKHTTMSMSPESGRVSKPVRKRSRASRRTPTTLLNTDPSNFRAMVQQFTGGPSFGSGSGFTNPNFLGAAAFGLGIGGSRDQAPPAGGGAMHVTGSVGGGYQIQYQQQQYHGQNRNRYSNVMYSGQGQDPSNPGGRLMMSDDSKASGMGMAGGRGEGEGASTARANSGGSNENTVYLF